MDRIISLIFINILFLYALDKQFSMRDKKDFLNLGHSPIENQLKSLKGAPATYNMHGLVEENKLAWFVRIFSQFGVHHYPYQTYNNTAVNNGIFKMHSNDNVTVALLSDWASNTPESHQVARLCGIQDYSIHLGDTYYVGNEKEIAENFNSTYGAPWPYGKYGSFALLGNHEMYSSGKSYFTQLLPYMGIYRGENTNNQEASFFCLENDHWRIIGLDTGYDSIKGFFNKDPNFQLQLQEKQLAWLRDVVRPNQDNRGIILLSHHQPLSAFEPAYTIPAQQLSEFFDADKTLLWFWGHEHRLAIYGENQLPCGKVYGRCIGNGGMPVELNSSARASFPDSKKNKNLIFYDNRLRETIDENIMLGHNGYVIISFAGQSATIKYYDDNDNTNTNEKRIITEEVWPNSSVCNLDNKILNPL